MHAHPRIDEEQGQSRVRMNSGMLVPLYNHPKSRQGSPVWGSDLVTMFHDGFRELLGQEILGPWGLRHLEAPVALHGPLHVVQTPPWSV